MNYERHALAEIEVDKLLLKEALQCVLHSIMFSRALGIVAPKELEAELLKVAYSSCGDSAATTAIDEAINSLSESLVPVGPDLGKGSLVVSFFAVREKSYFGLARTAERVTWEEWIVPVVVNLRPRIAATSEAAALDAERRNSVARDAVIKAMRDVFRLSMLRVEHMAPTPVSSTTPIPFTYEIQVPKQSEASWDWLSRIVKGGEPPTLS